MNDEQSYIQIRGVTKWYPRIKNSMLPGKTKSWIKAVDDVYLDLGRGEVLGIIGESGCGKSTLGRMLTRLEEPTRGDVLIDGTSTEAMIKSDFRAFRRKVQIVFQNPFDTFTPRDTIEKVLMRPLRIHKIGADDAKRREICIQRLEAGGLLPAEDILQRYPHELSGGQLQRISIIRSMLLDPSFIVADEPVSMLDVSVRAEIIRMLQTLVQEHNAALAFISHDIALTRYISDHIAVMYLGRIVEYGAADDVIKSPMHPYTQALISNCASVDPDDKSEPIAIEGEPPTPIDPGPGCYFAPRCHMARPECFEKYPQYQHADNDHYAACLALQGGEWKNWK